jgi:hypothetical protein
MGTARGEIVWNELNVLNFLNGLNKLNPASSESLARDCIVEGIPLY